MGRRSLLALLSCTAVLGAGIASAGEASAAPATSAAVAAAVSGRPIVDSVTPDAGPVAGGRTVTIRGARFADVDRVSIGGKKARDVHLLSSHVLTAVTPPHVAGSASISIKENAGTSKPSAARFHYVSRPRITAMSKHAGPVTGGQIVTLRGSNLSYLTAILFGALHATVLAHSTSTRLRVSTPASWAGAVQVVVVTAGGASARSAADRFRFLNPARRLTGQLTPATGEVIATGTDVAAVTGGRAVTSSTGVTQAPWVVTLAPPVAVPAVGRHFLLKPGGSAYPAGLAGTVTAVDSSTSPATITVSAPSGSLDSAVKSVRVVFSGPLGDAEASSAGMTRRDGTAGAGSSLTSTIDFGSISASTLNCLDPDGRTVGVTGSLSLRLEDVEAHLEVDTGSLLSKPFVDVWVSYQPTLAFNLTAEATAECTLPAAWQNTHEKLFVLGDTGATIAIAPDAAFTVSAGGTVSFQQHSYRILGFVSNPDGSITRLDGQSSDPAKVKVSAELKVEAYGGVQIQVGELNVIGVGMSLDAGLAATASSDWPPQVCLSAYPFLRGTLYAYLNVWVKEWKLQGFSVELDLGGISTCSGTGWHLARQSTIASLYDVACPTTQDCYAVGAMSGHGYILRTTDGGQAWTATTITAHTWFGRVACSDAAHCIVGGSGGRVAITSNGGASWSEVSLPYHYSPLQTVGSIACLPGGTCYVTAYMTRYSGELVYGSTNSGQTWTLDTVVNDEPNTMTCLSSTSCLSGGTTPTSQGILFPAASEATRDGWASSYTGSFPAHSLEPNQVSCMSLSLCYAAGFSDGVLATTNFGKTWKTVSDGGLPSNAVSCPTSTTCVVGGNAPDWAQYVEETVDGGHSWTKTTISTFPSADNMITVSLACPTLGHCMAIEAGNALTAIAVS
ncbi:MAG: IPT/TIG domain-containing protein [Streptosporangiaceae bacterium]